MSNFRSTFKSLLRDPLEISLVFDVFECKSCKYFWPYQNDVNTFGILPCFDYEENYPQSAQQNHGASIDLSINARLCSGQFPKPSILSGCRKAPLMILDVNPRLSRPEDRFDNACQVFPFFSSEQDTCDLFKYAYYHRYRIPGNDYIDLPTTHNAVQEHCIYAEKTGIVNNITFNANAHQITIELKYIDGNDQKLNLTWAAHESCYQVFVSVAEEFSAGTLLAAQYAYKTNEKVVLHSFDQHKNMHVNHILFKINSFLHHQKFEHAHLQPGEDVSFINLAACASPEWDADLFQDSTNPVMRNCVYENAWVLQQIAQSKPAVLMLNGETAFKLFCDAFGEYVHPFIPAFPADRAFRLFQQTCDLNKPYYFEYNGVIEDKFYQFNSRIVVLPNLIENDAFIPQIRISERNWERLMLQSPQVIEYLNDATDAHIIPPEQEYDFFKIIFTDSAAHVLGDIRRLDKTAHQLLLEYFYQPIQMITAVLKQEFAMGNLSCSDGTAKHFDRTDGDCIYCSNRYWSFPQGCPYGKIDKD